MVLDYHNMNLEDTELIEKLKGIVQPDDWEEMMGLKV